MQQIRVEIDVTKPQSSAAMIGIANGAQPSSSYAQTSVLLILILQLQAGTNS